jgi:hypothetical protein
MVRISSTDCGISERKTTPALDFAEMRIDLSDANPYRSHAGIMESSAGAYCIPMHQVDSQYTLNGTIFQCRLRNIEKKTTPAPDFAEIDLIPTDGQCCL